MIDESIDRRRELGEFGTPVTVLWDDILMLPISGVVDSKRGAEIMESACNKVFETNAKIIIIDILGVPVVDSQVAQQIINISNAIKMMGSQAVLTGVSPGIAQSLVQLKINLNDIVTKTTLKDGLEYSFSELGIKVLDSN